MMELAMPMTLLPQYHLCLAETLLPSRSQIQFPLWLLSSTIYPPMHKPRLRAWEVLIKVNTPQQLDSAESVAFQ